MPTLQNPLHEKKTLKLVRLQDTGQGLAVAQNVLTDASTTR